MLVLQYNDIQTIELELYLISIPWLIWYWTQFNSMPSNIDIQTESKTNFLRKGFRISFIMHWNVEVHLLDQMASL